MIRARCLLILVVCAACGGAPVRPMASQTVATPSVVMAPHQDVPPLRGFWRSEGYGFQFEFPADDELVLSQVTNISCLPGGSAKLVGRDPGAVTYRLVGDPVTLVVLPTSSTDRVRIHPTGAASEITATRLPQRLTACGGPTPNTPRSNFEVFAATWAENYPFFGLTSTDWTAVVSRERAKVSDQTTPAQLFDLLQGMISPFEDAHAFISAREQIGRHYEGFQNKPGSIDRPCLKRLKDSFAGTSPARFVPSAKVCSNSGR